MTGAPAMDRPDNDYEKVAATHVSLRRVLELFGPYRAKIAIVASLMLLGACADMSSPFLLRAIIDEALPYSDLHQLVGWWPACCSSLSCRPGAAASISSR
ncbi:ABC transporter ATP-binding protein [Methylosinus sp. C49]|uniref:ABC transporter ATP-binding protein n=1 Tax=Methylosinus sp. C49 TaxID=2699395 RepID=UPI0013797964|nr:ABC transporter ATP-binding protein [Methylosinus sp. C49]